MNNENYRLRRAIQLCQDEREKEVARRKNEIVFRTRQYLVAMYDNIGFLAADGLPDEYQKIVPMLNQLEESIVPSPDEARAKGRWSYPTVEDLKR